MSNKPFYFKQFAIEQGRTPMKVGTDGALLGAWCNALGKKQALDVGTGTGIIAMMLAQRFSDLQIHAIDINADAVSDASDNFKATKWHNRLTCVHADLRTYKGGMFDLIVSNPPYFINSSKNREDGKTMARHTDTLPFSDLLDFSQRFLDDDGQLDAILPIVEGELFIQLATERGLFLNRICRVKPKPYKDAHRLLLSFGKIKKQLLQEQLTIENDGRHNYTEEFKQLARDFYIIF